MQRRTLTRMLAALSLTTMLFPAVAAHPRAHDHRHRASTAVIVVGKPKPVRQAVVVNGTAQGVLDLNVKPKETEVWIDGRMRGTVDAFDGHPAKLHLRPGIHEVKLVTPEGIEVSRDLRVRAGVELNIGLDLR